MTEKELGELVVSRAKKFIGFGDAGYKYVMVDDAGFLKLNIINLQGSFTKPMRYLRVGISINKLAVSMCQEALEDSIDLQLLLAWRKMMDAIDQDCAIAQLSAEPVA